MAEPHVKAFLQTVESLMDGAASPAFGSPEFRAYMDALEAINAETDINNYIQIATGVTKLVTDRIIARNAVDATLRRMIDVR